MKDNIPVYIIRKMDLKNCFGLYKNQRITVVRNLNNGRQQTAQTRATEDVTMTEEDQVLDG
jgi:hypothetical protein